jgi:hypothetical protein
VLTTGGITKIISKTLFHYVIIIFVIYNYFNVNNFDICKLEIGSCHLVNNDRKHKIVAFHYLLIRGQGQFIGQNNRLGEENFAS